MDDVIIAEKSFAYESKSCITHLFLVPGVDRPSNCHRCFSKAQIDEDYHILYVVVAACGPWEWDDMGWLDGSTICHRGFLPGKCLKGSRGHFVVWRALT